MTDYGYILTLLYWLNVVVAIWIMLRVVLGNRNPVATFAWIFVLLFIPYVGLILYFFFGRETRRRKYIRERFRLQIEQKALYSYRNDEEHDASDEYSALMTYLERSADAYPMSGCCVEHIADTSDFFTRLLTEISLAKEHIHLQFYIFENDGLGRRIRDALIERIKNGVEVRLLYDSVGCWSVNNSFYDEIRRAGGYVEPFLKVYFPLLTNKVNNRNHRKSVIIDGRLAYLGGCNIADRYVKGINGGVWRDTMIAVRGSGVYAVQSLFLMDWFFASGSVVSGKRYFPTLPSCGDAVVQVASSNPIGLWRTIPGALVKLLLSAKSYVYLQTPYFMPNETVLKAMQNAALSGVDVRLMIPLHSDNSLVDNAAYSYLGMLLSAGVKVYLFHGGFLHAKTIVTDDNLSVVGSANLDFRSFEYNFEISAYVYSDTLACDIRNRFIEDMQWYRQLTLREFEARGLYTRLKQSVSRLFSPIM
jgi:cardiolipin synthase